jgi:hypothetical protein
VLVLQHGTIRQVPGIRSLRALAMPAVCWRGQGPEFAADLNGNNGCACKHYGPRANCGSWRTFGQIVKRPNPPVGCLADCGGRSTRFQAGT